LYSDRMRKLAVALFVVSAVGLVGCSKPSVEGKWESSAANVEGLPPGAEAKFIVEYAGSNVTATLDMQKPIPLKMIATGTYTFDGTKLDHKFAKVDVDTSKLPAMARPLVEAQLKKEDLAAKMSGQQGITFEGGDTMIQKGAKGDTKFTRVKA